MKLEFIATSTKNNKGVNELFKLVAKKGSISCDFKKNKICIENFPCEKIDNILSIIQDNFDTLSLELNNEKKYKLRNTEKDLQNKKKELVEAINKKPTSLSSKVKSFILNERVFTLTGLREAFPKANFATLRAYVNDMKNENIITELDRGKYAVR